MKKLYFSLFPLFVFAYSFGQCESATELCIPTSGVFSFPNLTDTNNNEAPTACISTVSQNVMWRFLRFSGGGTYSFNLKQTDLDGNDIDLDYVLYGPFIAPTCGAVLEQGNPVSCDGTGNNSSFDITLNVPNQTAYYMLKLSNYSNEPGTISVQQLNYTPVGTATLYCIAPTCPFSASIYSSPCELWPMSAHITTVVGNEGLPVTYTWTLNGETLPVTTSEIDGYGAGEYTVTASFGICSPTIAFTVEPAPHFAHETAPDLVACTGQTVNLAQNESVIVSGENTTNFEFQYHHTYADAINVANPISNINTYTPVDGEVIYYSVQDLISTETCLEVGSFTIDQQDTPILESITVDAQTATVNVTGDMLMYAVDGGAFIPINIFTDLPLGTHTILVQNQCGSVSSTFDIVIPSAPTGDITQEFTPGATLADIQINGQNILWYASAADLMASNPLPANTVLVDGATYYASQTINGIESPQRLAVTVSLSLGLNEHSLVNLSYEPNPVKGNLIFHNSNEIDKVQIFGISGQLLIEKKIGSISGNLDFSSYPQGIYFVKFESGSGSKTVRIIK